MRLCISINKRALTWLLACLAVTISLKSHHQANIPSRLHVRGCLKRCVHYIFVCVNVLYLCLCLLAFLSAALSRSLCFILYAVYTYICNCGVRVRRVSFALSHMDCIKSLSVCSRDSIMLHSQPPPRTRTHMHTISRLLSLSISLLLLFRCFNSISLLHPSIVVIVIATTACTVTQLGCRHTYTFV